MGVYASPGNQIHIYNHNTSQETDQLFLLYQSAPEASGVNASDIL